MPEIFKSSTSEADNASNSVTMRGAAIQDGRDIITGSTNLPAMDNLSGLNDKMNSCNAHFKKLLNNHAESIRQLAQEFTDFDLELSDKMTAAKE